VSVGIGFIADQRVEEVQFRFGEPCVGAVSVTSAGLPLGLAAIKFWTRDEFKGCKALEEED